MRAPLRLTATTTGSVTNTNIAKRVIDCTDYRRENLYCLTCGHRHGEVQVRIYTDVA